MRDCASYINNKPKEKVSGGFAINLDPEKRQNTKRQRRRAESKYRKLMKD